MKATSPLEEIGPREVDDPVRLPVEASGAPVPAGASVPTETSPGRVRTKASDARDAREALRPAVAWESSLRPCAGWPARNGWIGTFLANTARIGSNEATVAAESSEKDRVGREDPSLLARIYEKTSRRNSFLFL